MKLCQQLLKTKYFGAINEKEKSNKKLCTY